MTEPVTIIIPVTKISGLQDTVDSILSQTLSIDELFFIDDIARLTIPECCRLIKEPGYAEECYYKPYYNMRYFNCSGYTKKEIRQRGGKGKWHCTGAHHDRDLYLSYWRSPCPLGETLAVDIGIALSDNPIIFYVFPGDTLKPNAVESVMSFYKKHKQKSDALHNYTQLIYKIMPTKYTNLVFKVGQND